MPSVYCRRRIRNVLVTVTVTLALVLDLEVMLMSLNRAIGLV